MAPRLREYRAVFHCHCHLSHDSEGTVEEISAAARELGIDIVLLTDHYEPGNICRSPRGLYDGVLFVPGVELRLPGGGSLLVVGPRSDFPKGESAESLMHRFRQDGAILVAGHVEKIADDRGLGDFHGFEVYNLHAQFSDAPRLPTLLRLLAYPVDAFFEAALTHPEANLRRWDRELREGRRLTPLAGHDAHANVRLFGALGGTVGTYEEVFRLFSTRILAPALDETSILEALRRGHVFVVFDYLGDPAGFSMRYGPLAEGADREKRVWAIPGDRTVYRKGARLEVRVPSNTRLRLLRNGQLLAEVRGNALSRELPGPGIYRLEAYRDDRVWILTGPLYLSAGTRE